MNTKYLVKRIIKRICWRERYLNAYGKYVELWGSHLNNYPIVDADKIEKHINKSKSYNRTCKFLCDAFSKYV